MLSVHNVIYHGFRPLPGSLPGAPVSSTDFGPRPGPFGLEAAMDSSYSMEHGGFLCFITCISLISMQI